MDGVIIGSAARNESVCKCFKYRSDGKNRIDRYWRWKCNRQWLHKLSWRYQQKKKRMYVDDHEGKDVVKYWKEFVECWKEYEKHFVIYDYNGNIFSTPTRFPVPQGVWFRLILLTHNKSTFYKNDCRKKIWLNNETKAVAEKKEEGQSWCLNF